MAATLIAGVSMTVTGTEISIPWVRLFFVSSTMITWVMPTLYPAKPCSLGSPVASGQALNRGMWLFALLRGLYAREPRFGRCMLAIFLLRKFQLKCQPLRSAQHEWKKKKHTGFPERYQVGRDVFRPAWHVCLEQTRALCSRYLNSFRHLQYPIL